MAAEGPAGRPGRGGSRSLGRWSGLLLLATLLLLWQWSATSLVSSTNWPPVTTIAAAMVSSILSGELTEALGSSLARMLAGYTAGGLLAIVVGLLMASFRLVRAALEPLVELLRPIPIPAIVPPLILILGIDDAMKIFVVAFSAFFPILLNTMAGVRAVDRTAIDVARTLQVGRWRTLWRVVLPASLPSIFAGLRISLALALIVTVVAEMIAGSSGIGYYLMTMQYAMRAGDMYASIFLLAATGYALNGALWLAERRLLHWYHR